MNSDDDNMFAQPAAEATEEESKQEGGSSQIKKVRKYDLSITYDFYT